MLFPPDTQFVPFHSICRCIGCGRCDVDREKRGTFSLKENKTAEILTSADEKAVIEINDGIVTEGSILIRFIVWGLRKVGSQRFLIRIV
jgi:hypothetical protein